jgi:hypothetical protein
MNTIKPIKPSEVAKTKLDNTPPFVIDICNKLIAKYWDGHRSEFTLKEVRDLIEKEVDVRDLYATNYNASDLHRLITSWLDIEEIYRKEGWEVVFDRPYYNETYNAFFRFSVK